MKLPVYTMEGKQIREIELSDAVFADKTSSAAVHQVVLALQANERLGTANTKTRGEVRGGGRKPWKQKGTGHARHGSIRSPLWRKGGVVFGPLKERNYTQTVPASMRKKALRSVLSDKAAGASLVVVQELPNAKKTKDWLAAFTSFKKSLPAFAKFIDKNTMKKSNQALCLTAGHKPELVRAGRNVPVLKIEEARNANVVDLLKYRVCVIEEQAVPVLEKIAKK